MKRATAMGRTRMRRGRMRMRGGSLGNVFFCKPLSLTVPGPEAAAIPAGRCKEEDCRGKDGVTLNTNQK